MACHVWEVLSPNFISDSNILKSKYKCKPTAQKDKNVIEINFSLPYN